MPILWNRRWNWLNYYDFSLTTSSKLAQRHRLRDEHLPGIITTLVWYQWSLGILYIALLLWTLSRTIPGLNYCSTLSKTANYIRFTILFCDVLLIFAELLTFRGSYS
jgi:hypothetical protein